MKKFILSLLVCMTALSVSAQIKTVDLKANLRSDFGIGLGLTQGLTDYVDVAYSFNYYFPDNGNAFTLDGDFHYNIELNNDSWTVYPIGGLTFFHHRFSKASLKDDSNRFGLNLGCGTRFYLTDQLSLFGEVKYQFMKHEDDVYITLGINLNI